MTSSAQTLQLNNMQQNRLKASMLGNFKMTYRGQEIRLKYGPSTKVMQLLAILLYNAPGQVTVNKLLDTLFCEDDVLNPKNKLKVSVSQLRKALPQAGIPGSVFITYKDGSYSWQNEILVELDVRTFDQVIRLAREAESSEEKIHYYEQALSLYEDHFLKDMGSLDWTTEISAHYDNCYQEVISDLSALLKEEGRYEEALRYIEKAIRIDPSEEYLIMKIDCLMQLGRWKEAQTTFQDTVVMLDREYGVRPSQYLLERYQVISRNMKRNFNTLDDLVQSVKEKDREKGAYFCSFPSFIDTYRISSRIAERSGKTGFLVLMNLTDRNGNPLESEKLIAEAGEKVRTAIQESLRSGDYFTQYNSGQFLIYLSSLTRENCDEVAERIRKNYRRDPVRGAHIFYSVAAGSMSL